MNEHEKIYDIITIARISELERSDEYQNNKSYWTSYNYTSTENWFMAILTSSSTMHAATLEHSVDKLGLPWTDQSTMTG